MDTSNVTDDLVLERAAFVSCTHASSREAMDSPRVLHLPTYQPNLIFTNFDVIGHDEW